MNKLIAIFQNLLLAFAIGACNHSPDDVTTTPGDPSEGLAVPTSGAIAPTADHYSGEGRTRQVK